MRRADGEYIAVLRKGRANLVFIWAAAHAQRQLAKMEVLDNGNKQKKSLGNNAKRIGFL